jgi:glycosyltransferase involved in cell wall biosynthesis
MAPERVRRPRVVALWANSSTLGGGEIFTLELARALKAMSTDVVLLLPPQSPLTDRAAEAGIPVHIVDLAPKLGRRTALRAAARYLKDRLTVRRVVSEYKAQGGCVVLQYKWEQILLGSDPASSAVIVLEHGPIPRLLLLPVLRTLLRRTYESSASLVAVSVPASDSIARVTSRVPKLVLAGVDPISAEQALETARQLRDSSWPGAGVRQVAVVSGRVAASKGIFRAIEVVHRMSGWGLWIVGDGPDRAEAEQEVAALGVRDRVRFTGHSSKPLTYVAASDVMLALSTDPGEGRPLTVLESLSVGTPVVGLRSQPAFVALCAEEHRGLYSAADDPVSIATAMRRSVASAPPTFSHSWEATARAFLTQVPDESLGTSIEPHLRELS